MIAVDCGYQSSAASRPLPGPLLQEREQLLRAQAIKLVDEGRGFLLGCERHVVLVIVLNYD